MTFQEMNKWIGTKKYWKHGELSIPAMVLDLRRVYNRIDAKISPCGGTGEQWVEICSLRD